MNRNVRGTTVRVFCDAGWSAPLGSWAVRSQHGAASGRTRLATCNNTAEMEAICYAVERFRRLPAARIVIHSDSTTALRWVAAETERVPEGAASAIRERLDRALRRAEAAFSFEHMRAGRRRHNGINACHGAATRELHKQHRR